MTTLQEQILWARVREPNHRWSTVKHAWQLTKEGGIAPVSYSLCDVARIVVGKTEYEDEAQAVETVGKHCLWCEKNWRFIQAGLLPKLRHELRRD